MEFSAQQAKPKGSRYAVGDRVEVKDGGSGKASKEGCLEHSGSMRSLENSVIVPDLTKGVVSAVETVPYQRYDSSKRAVVTEQLHVYQIELGKYGKLWYRASKLAKMR